MEKLFVIKVVNTSQVELKKWYRKKGGELYIVRLNAKGNGYTTVGYIDEECSIGHIEPYFCEVLTSFEHDEG
ncbi:hypothetical protein [Fictibacillus nanhaiensis]|uniref:hypothetical protein n=1 Tax=Fictibacillus nanhaiensis TaxID=742169 RepID=UPI003C23CE1A